AIPVGGVDRQPIGPGFWAENPPPTGWRFLHSELTFETLRHRRLSDEEGCHMRSTTWRSGFGLACLVVLATAAYARAADELIPGKNLIVQTLIERPRARLIAKPLSGSFDLPTGDPRVSGGTLQIFDTGSGSSPMFVNLPAAGWKGIGVPPGSNGYYYNGDGSPGDPCLSVLVWGKSVKFVCRGAGVTLD